jgi:uncharacterized surface protein with fasciclin (FAS1) repeats
LARWHGTILGFALEADGAVGVDHPGVWSPHSVNVEGVSKMLGRMSRGLCVAVLALAFSGWAAAQEPKKPEAKPEAKPEIKKPEAAPQEKKEEGKDIVQVAKDAKFNTLCELLQLAGLVDTLKGKGPFTVFAPTDDAFKALGKELDDLKKPENKEKLAGILKAHVHSGKMMAADVAKATAIKALNGELKVAAKDGKVTLNDKINVTKTDVAASNGVIHVIDAVVVPAEKKVEAKPEMKKEEPKKEAPKPEAKKEEPKKEPPKKEGEKKPEQKPGEKKG